MMILSEKQRKFVEQTVSDIEWAIKQNPDRSLACMYVRSSKVSKVELNGEHLDSLSDLDGLDEDESFMAQLNTNLSMILVEDNREQDDALRRYFNRNRFSDCFATNRRIDDTSEMCEVLTLNFKDDQTSSPRFGGTPFAELKLAIEICKSTNLPLVYCELGSFYKHSEFFSLIRNAKRFGVSIKVVYDAKVLAEARQYTKNRKPKKWTTNKPNHMTKAQKLEITNQEKDAWHEFKSEHKINPRRLRSLFHLVDDADPIYKYFLTDSSKDFDEPKKWNMNLEYNSQIAKRLNDMGHLTPEGYMWNKNMVQRFKTLVAKDKLFHDFFLEHQMQIEEWETKQ